jgi:hypothetical protein
MSKRLPDQSDSRQEDDRLVEAVSRVIAGALTGLFLYVLGWLIYGSIAFFVGDEGPIGLVLIKVFSLWGAIACAVLGGVLGLWLGDRLFDYFNPRESFQNGPTRHVMAVLRWLIWW